LVQLRKNFSETADESRRPSVFDPSKQSAFLNVTGGIPFLCAICFNTSRTFKETLAKRKEEREPQKLPIPSQNLI
jgi:hypothetical protein